MKNCEAPIEYLDPLVDTLNLKSSDKLNVVPPSSFIQFKCTGYQNTPKVFFKLQLQPVGHHTFNVAT